MILVIFIMHTQTFLLKTSIMDISQYKRKINKRKVK